ncbi:MAG TPA: poly(R)-hydroxyalkanoic acid synthase subunit PhaE [Rhodanobacteraceae bacterium]|nr:poly(R)-hydroxyalkanoic acid synthase subunit PhaE [Rhodanobacteraceae bacterium]
MATQSSLPYGDFQQMAEQSLAAWKSLWSQAMASAPAARAPAGDTLEAGVTRLLDGLRNYCAWLETVGATSAATPDGLRWDQAFAKSFAGNLGQPFAQAFGEMADLGPLASDAWMQNFARMAAPVPQALRQMFDVPAFGLAREHQEQAQALGKAWLDYQEQSARYQALIARVGRMAAERLQDKLAERDAPGRQIETLRALYDLWVDGAEEVYAEVALSDEFREVYGAMVNAQMRVRSLLQKQVEEASSQLGIPTRSEVDSLGRRVQEMRRTASPASLQAMREEMEQLRQELAELRGNQRAVGGARSKTTNPAKPAGTKKPATAATSKTRKPARRT